MNYYHEEGTTSLGPVAKASILAVGLLCISGTSTGGTDCSMLYIWAPSRTSAEPIGSELATASPEAVESTAASISGIRQLGNLTWDETAKLFGVSRRTVHHWAGGRPAAADQERKINRLYGALRTLNGRAPTELRAQLMSSLRPGELYFDRLCQGDLNVVASLLAAYPEKRVARRPSVLQVANYRLPSPLAFTDALQDRPILSVGKALPSKGVRPSKNRRA